MSKWCHKFGDGPGVTAKLCQWLMPDGPIKPGNNYVNPKAHKPKKDYPGRLISTSCASAIKNLSALTAHELTKVELDYAAKDTNHILRNRSAVGAKQSRSWINFSIICLQPLMTVRTSGTIFRPQNPLNIISPSP